MRYIGKKEIATSVDMVLSARVAASVVYEFVRKKDLGVSKAWDSKGMDWISK